ncbi:PTS sugar transporter subunit IIA [Levilactobacillus namurensis]|uniref:PTS sugar transporter subunit IIA n=1 Tax=Levilactobacillus namurensis TaxID=380393 RepID=UPI00222FFA11|nr:PTS sugar transporter subunit IIA [Levilactobacillus namurensis]MCW3779217.1 PTS sugar transporter subunit IIA [Levilactobacillus namurensis]MDT7019960.1 PTS sugar transporter subunit IIA [Levilactobacillus namurensis]WNN65462.1 PTS sugar transporter subunit IIA [Levilactobacillus namurensis]
MEKVEGMQRFVLHEPIEKDALFERVCSNLQDEGVITSSVLVEAALRKRERLSSTLIDEQTAMPHCQETAVHEAKIVLVDCHQFPVKWTEEGIWVTGVVFLFLSEQTSQEQLLAMRSFVRGLADHQVVQALFQTKSVNNMTS